MTQDGTTIPLPTDSGSGGSEDTPAPGGLSGLAALVEDGDVHAQLLQRAPELFDEEDNAAALISIKRGVGIEVQQLCGGVPPEGDLRELAVWAVVLGVAAQVETALFPEQSLGDGGRAQVLQGRYLGVRAQLAAAINSGAGGPGAGNGVRFGGFEPPQPWPDASIPWGSPWPHPPIGGPVLGPGASYGW